MACALGGADAAIASVIRGARAITAWPAIQRVANADFMLERERAEVWRLVEAIRTTQLGRPVVWPAASGVPLDEVTEALRVGSSRLGVTGSPSSAATGEHATYGAGHDADPHTTSAAFATFSMPPARDQPGQGPGYSPTPISPEYDVEAQLPNWLRPER